jgi:uncharacterized membrane protein
MDSAQTSGVRKTLTRLLNVGFDGLVQAAVVAMVVFVLGVIWAWGRHLDVVWINRVEGALLAAFSIFIISSFIIAQERISGSQVGCGNCNAGIADDHR